MLMGVLLAVALAAGAHPAALAIVVIAFLWPPLVLVLASGWAGYHALLRARERRERPRREADFLRGMAAEIDAGASVRRALIAGAARAPGLALGPAVHFASAGRPASEVAAHLRDALPVNGRLAAAAYTLVAETGARAAAVFAGLAVRASEAGEVARERRAVTAQSRLSATLVGGVPAGVTVAMTLLGRGPGSSGAGTAITLAGFALIGAGGLVVWLMVRRG